MSEVKSPLGVKKINNSNMRQFEVPDESGSVENARHVESSVDVSFDAEVERIKRREERELNRRNAVSGKDRLPAGAVERIGLLLELTQNKKVVNLSNEVYFEIRSLKTSELKDVVLLTNKVSQLEAPFEMRRQYLARTIVKVAGHDFSSFLGSNELSDKLLFVDDLDDAVASRLYEEYLILNSETQDKFKMKTEADTKETLADLKK